MSPASGRPGGNPFGIENGAITVERRTVMLPGPVSGSGRIARKAWWPWSGIEQAGVGAFDEDTIDKNIEANRGVGEGTVCAQPVTVTPLWAKAPRSSP